MKVFSFEYMHNTRLLTAVIGLILYVKLTNTAHPGSSYGENVVFMYDEKLAQFKPSCKCHIEGTETSHFHKWFKLEEDGPTYDLCYAGSYVAEITSTKAVCKPCIIGTYNPSPNACPYCLMCRTCGELENEVTECSSTVNRICECKSGESCYSAPFNESITTPANVPTITNETKKSSPQTPSSTSYQYTLSSNPQTTGTVTTLPFNENSTCPPCEIGTQLIVPLVVSGIFNLTMLILIVVYLKSSCTNRQEVSGSREERLLMVEVQIDIGISDHVIELLVNKIGKDYHTIGIALELTQEQLEQIDMNNKHDVRDAVRSMLFAARRKHASNKQCEEFIKAFKKCNRQDLTDIIINDAKERGVDLPIATPENGTDKCLKYTTEESE